MYDKKLIWAKYLQNIFLCTVPLDTTTLRLLGRENRILSFLQIKKLKFRLSKNHLKTYNHLVLNPGFRPQVSESHNRVYLHYTLLMLSKNSWPLKTYENITVIWNLLFHGSSKTNSAFSTEKYFNFKNNSFNSQYSYVILPCKNGTMLKVWKKHAKY